MKKLLFSTAAIMLAFSVNTFAGTPETKDAKAAKTETTSSGVFHYVSESTTEGQFRVTGNWQEGPSPRTDCGDDDIKPCEIMAEDETELAAKLSNQSNAAVLNLTISNRP